jgi:hypothetical protein
VLLAIVLANRRSATLLAPVLQAIVHADRRSATLLALDLPAIVHALRRCFLRRASLSLLASRLSCAIIGRHDFSTAINRIDTTLLPRASRLSCAIVLHDAEQRLWRRNVPDTQDLVPTFRDNTVKAVDFDAVDMLDPAESEERFSDLQTQPVEGRCVVLLYDGIHPFVIAEKQQLQTQLHHCKTAKGRDGGRRGFTLVERKLRKKTR